MIPYTTPTMKDLDKGSYSLLICTLAAVIFTVICLALCVHKRNRCRKTKNELDKDKYKDQKMQNLHEDQKMQTLYEDQEMKNREGLEYADIVFHENTIFQNRSRDQYVDLRTTIVDLNDVAGNNPVAWAPLPPPPPPDPPNPHSRCFE